MRLVEVAESSETFDAVLAVDPGLTTGWATWVEGEVRVGQTEGQIEFLQVAWEVLHKYRPTLVVEAYIITGNTVRLSRQYEALELIGALRWMAHLLGLTFILQTPRQAKEFSTDGKLKTVGWYEKAVGHGNDAARHLLLHMVATRKEEGLINTLLQSL